MLTCGDIGFVIHQWIRVEGGYLGDFSYGTHRQFYHDYCGIDDIDPNDYEGTTRERFRGILSEAPPSTQIRILQGILTKYPVGSADHRTQDRYDRIMELIVKCEGGILVSPVELALTTEVIESALDDAETLLQTNPVGAVDRSHTALHGFLKAICEQQGIAYEQDSALTQLFKNLRECDHMKAKGDCADDIQKILHGLASVVDSINTLRNRHSLAHPNEQLLGRHEALLAVNAMRTLCNYVNSKVRESLDQ